jgi:hypothetical protein
MGNETFSELIGGRQRASELKKRPHHPIAQQLVIKILKEVGDGYYKRL